MAAAVQLTEATTSKFAQAGKIKVHYNEAGTGDALFFLHGSGPGASSWSNFNRNVGPLSENYRCLLVDQPGYGKTDSVTMTTESRSTVNARAVKELMDTLGIEKASLVGNSMGGGTALAFAVDYPDRLEKMVLMGSGGGGVNIFSHQPSEGIKQLNYTFDHPSVEEFRKLINIMLYDGSQVPDSLLEQRYEAVKATPGHLEARKNSVNVQRDLSADLPDIKAPALIIHGRNDRVVPLEGSLRLLTALENSRLVVFNHCGHWAQFEHANLFNRLVEDFLAND